MQPLLRSRPQQIAAAVVVALVIAIGFLPLFGGPGYEHALASGLIVPSAAAIATALELSRAPRPAPIACVGRGLLAGLVLALLAYVVALVHGLFLGLCDLAGDTLYYALTAAAGALMGGLWGAVVAEVARRRKRRRLVAVLLSLALPLASALVSVWRFYASPMIFAFDPFVGYFSGTLYDTVIDAGGALVSYRLGSACTAMSLVLAASVLVRTDPGRLALAPRGPGVVARGLLALAAFAASVAVTAYGPELGHWQTPATIARALGGFRGGARCDLVYPDSLRPDEVDLLMKDCDEQLAADEAVLGARGPEKITAFFFRDAGEKKHLMGAENTYIAKPWRHEVYLQLSTYPHPVLGHELAHVVAGSFGRGPFRIAGAFGGLWPNPGLIEGTAVAASPDDDELTDAQWAKAMMQIGILPPMKSVFSVGFLGQNSAKSYTIAGAFVRWIVGLYGADVLRAWYGGGSIEALTKKSWGELDAAFRAAIATEPLSPEADAFARAKFDRPSVFGRKCPHVIDLLKRDAARCEDTHRIDEAVSLYHRVLARDPHDFGAEVRLGATELRYRDEASGRAELARIAGDAAAPRTFRDHAEEALADGDLLAGRFDEAAARYRALAARTLDEDAGRNLEVKALVATRPLARDAVAPLLIGEPGRPPDGFLGAVNLGVWAAREEDPLADYLVGRNFATRGFYPEAARSLDRAIAEAPGAPDVTPRLLRELLRIRAACACAMRDSLSVARVRSLVEGEGSPFTGSAGRREWVLRLLARCK